VTRALIAALLIASAAFACVRPAHAQEALWGSLRQSNSRMAALQPSWIAPLIQSDPRLMQGLRVSFSRASAPGAARVFSYGNNHGVGVIAGTRFQFDFNPPAFFRNHTAQLPDGWGNASTQVKFRIASGNADHGNFAVSASLEHGFASGAAENGMATAYDMPRIAAGKSFGGFDIQSTLGGVLPSGKIDQQGRLIEWNIAGQVHTTAHTWLDIENNAAFVFGGPFDGKTQNYVTPAAFYILKRSSWGPAHPVAVLDGGMQIATSHFNFCNHNLVTELRILF
jgi:hypothetical protein